jgi:peptide subunit release factor RF-3
MLSFQGKFGRVARKNRFLAEANRKTEQHFMSSEAFQMDPTDQERLAAMRVIADAMEEGMRQGLQRDSLTVGCFSVIMQMMVEVYGRDAVREMVAGLEPRIVAGDFG